MSGPKVSVIMPVFNGEEFIAQAVRSVLEQTFSDLELIVVSESGTSQASLAEVDKFDDPRLVHVQNTERLGLIASLNRGLKLAKGKYIARMDSDDISMPERLEKQVAFLEAHPEVGVLGTMVAYIDAQGRRTHRPRYFHTPEGVAWDMLFNSPVPHPSAMMRAEVVKLLDGYDPGALLVEDYDLWLRASHVTTVTNLPDELVLIRKHGENITVTRREEQSRAASALAAREMATLMSRPVDGDVAYWLRNPRQMTRGEDTLKAADLLNSLHDAFTRKHGTTTGTLDMICSDMIRQYSVLVSEALRRRWRLTGKLLSKARGGAGLSRTAVLAQALARRVLSR